jgi:hypothetical protein
VVSASSTRPLIVQTDRGRFFVKLLNGAEGPKALAAEWLCADLASRFGLPTLELVRVELAAELARTLVDGELREAVQRGAGLCLGFRELPGAIPVRADELSSAPEEFALPLLWLDILVENPDRRRDNPNVLRSGSLLVPIDHATCLGFHHDWRVNEQTPARDVSLPPDHVCSAFGERLGVWSERLANRLTSDSIENACASIPSEWLGSLVFGTEARQKQAYAAYLHKRLRVMERTFLRRG